MDPKEITIEENALKAISGAVVEALTPVITENINTAVDKKMEEVEKTVNKAVKSDDPENKISDNPIADEAKELRLMKAAMALVNGNKSLLKEYNDFVIGKAGYANTEVNGDGGYIVMDPEFEADVEKLSAMYGVAFTDADVRSTTRNAIKTNKRGSNVVMYETNQGAKKTGTKLVIQQVLVELRKFAAIAVATDELVEDAAIDFWADVADGFAEERARIADELVFTDDDATYPGILHTDGVAVETVGASITSIVWDDLLNAEVAVPTRSMKNGKHYMHRTVWNVVRKSKDSEGRYQLVPAAGTQTPWGTPVELVDVLPDVHMVGDGNEGYAVFGDLKRVRLYVKKGLVLTPSTDATVVDADGTTVDLYAQDMTALRAVCRMVAMIKFPEAFCVIGTGTVS